MIITHALLLVAPILSCNLTNNTTWNTGSSSFFMQQERYGFSPGWTMTRKIFSILTERQSVVRTSQSTYCQRGYSFVVVASGYHSVTKVEHHRYPPPCYYYYYNPSPSLGRKGRHELFRALPPSTTSMHKMLPTSPHLTLQYQIVPTLPIGQVLDVL